WDEEKAKTYPDCYEIIERLVKPERQRWKKDSDGNEIIGKYALRKPLPQKWWIYAEKRPALYRTISGLEQVMTINNHSKYHIFLLCQNNMVFSHALTVFASDSYYDYAIVNSRVM